MGRLLIQTRYMLNDIWCNKFSFLLGLTQIIISLVLLCYIFQLSVTYHKTMEKLDSLTQNTEIYHLQLLAEQSQIDAVLNNKEKMDKLNLLMKYIHDLPVQKYVLNRTTDMYFDKKATPFSQLGENVGESTMIPAVRVTPNFFQIFGVRGTFKQEIAEYKFSKANSKQPVPVILGYDYTKYFNVGDKFSNENKQYEVIGILDKEEFVVVPYESDKAVYLNNSIILPDSVDNDAFSSLVSTCFRTDDTEFLKKVLSKSNHLNLWPLGYESFEDQINEGRTDMLNEIMTMSTIMVILFIFASIGIVSYIVRLITNRFVEFSIHMIYGANKNDVILRIFIQVIFIMLISIVVAGIVFGGIVQILIPSSLLLLYGLCILWVPYFKIKKTSIVYILRRYAK